MLLFSFPFLSSSFSSSYFLSPLLVFPVDLVSLSHCSFPFPDSHLAHPLSLCYCFSFPSSVSPLFIMCCACVSLPPFSLFQFLMCLGVSMFPSFFALSSFLQFIMRYFAAVSPLLPLFFHFIMCLPTCLTLFLFLLWAVISL